TIFEILSSTTARLFRAAVRTLRLGLARRGALLYNPARNSARALAINPDLAVAAAQEVLLMARSIRCLSILTVALASAGRLSAQNVAPDDPPRMLKAKAASPQEADRRAALYSFVRGHICERKER